MYMGEWSQQIWYSVYQSAVVQWLACWPGKLETLVQFPAVHAPIITSRAIDKLFSYLIAAIWLWKQIIVGRPLKNVCMLGQEMSSSAHSIEAKKSPDH